MRRLMVAAVMVMALPGVAWAGGGVVDTSGCAGYSEGAEVGMLDSCFSGTAHFAPGGTLTVSNDGTLPHTLTAVDGSFDTGTVASGGSAELSIDEPGVYRVFCALHGTAQGEGMAGVLVVGEPTPAATALPADTSVISEAVAAETDRVMQAVESATPQVVTVEGDVDPMQLVVLVMVGLAAGLALSALLTVLRLRIAGDSARLESLRPSVES